MLKSSLVVQLSYHSSKVGIRNWHKGFCKVLGNFLASIIVLPLLRDTILDLLTQVLILQSTKMLFRAQSADKGFSSECWNMDIRLQFKIWHFTFDMLR
jgi:hypothetical protein